ncbi:MAG: DMT family transporter [Reinekea sp.]|jgi:drug/metabolite transporter (DMT)-like permease
MEKNNLRAHLALLVAMIVWGSSFIALKTAVTAMSPMIVVFLRMTIGAVAFLVVWPWLRHGLRYQQGDWKYLIGMALFEPCLYFLFEVQALQYTSAGQAGMITALLPLLVAATAFYFLKERNTLRQWSGLIIAVLGVIVMTVTSQSTDQAPNALLGNALEVCAMMAAVGYIMLAKHLIHRYSAFVLTATQQFVGALFFLPMAAQADWPSELPMIVFGSVIYLGLVVSIGAYGLYNYSLAQLNASTAAGYTNLIPVFTLMFSMLLLGERMQRLQWLAIGLVFVGVFLSQKTTRVVPKDVPPGVTG